MRTAIGRRGRPRVGEVALVTGTTDSDDVRIGALAAATGLTVRTLHHYESIGLIGPARRSTSGYRLHGSATG
jgi:hypothetical protein